MDMTSSNVNCTMDPNLWGTLQHHIDLENVYLRLPLSSFFRLRGVCKAWNGLAHQRRSFGSTEGVQKPYFVIVYPAATRVGVAYHAGILTLHIASGQWRWNRLPVNSGHLVSREFLPFSVNGLVFCSSSHWVHEVYNTHTKETQTLLKKTIMRERSRVAIVAMTVDYSATPYKFTIIRGGLNTDTCVDAHPFGNWWPSLCRSRIPVITGQRWPTLCMKSCVERDDCVYTWGQTAMIHVYSLREDKWTTLNPPENDGVGGALGCWDHRLFLVKEDGELSVSVWELVDESRQAWRQFARIPGEMYSWLVASPKEPVLASFCDRYVLVYTLLSRYDEEKGISNHFVLFDLATKQWEKKSLWGDTQPNSDDAQSNSDDTHSNSDDTQSNSDDT